MFRRSLLVVVILGCMLAGRPSSAQDGGPARITSRTAGQVQPLAQLFEGDGIAAPAAVGILAGRAGQGGAVPGVAWSPGGDQLAVYSHRGTWLVDARDFTRVPRLLEGDLVRAGYPAQPVVVYSPDGRLILTASAAANDQAGGGVALWETASGTRIASFPVEMATVDAAAFSADGGWLAVGGCRDGVAQDFAVACEAGGLLVWEAAAGQPRLTLEGYRDSVSSLAFSLDGRLLAADDGQQVRLWDLASAEVLHAWESPAPAGWSNTLAFSADGRRLIMARGDIEVWRLDTYTLERVLRSDDDRLGYANVYVLPNGAVAASGRLYEGVPLIQRQVIWDGEQVVVHTELPSDAVRAAISPDGTRIAYSGASVAIAGLRDQAVQAILARPVEARALSFSPDGSELAVGGGFAQGGPATIWRWDAASGQLLQRYASDPQAENRMGGLGTLRYLSDGRLIGSMALGGDLAVWASPSLAVVEQWALPEGITLAMQERRGTVALLTNLGTIILRAIS